MSSMTSYVRRSNPRQTLQLWHFLDESETGDRSSAEIIEQFGQKVFSNALQDKLVVIGTIDESRASVLSNMVKPRATRFRYRPSYDRSRFGDVSHDWFCFHCHGCRQDIGPLVGCQNCFRSFHRDCLTSEDVVGSEQFVCIYCQNCSQVDQRLKVNRISRSEKNRLFAMVLRKLEDSIPGFDIYGGYKLGPNPKTKVLIFKYLDLNDIRRKILYEKYENIYELENDFKHFVHNFMVYRITGLSQQFEPFLKYHFEYLKMCSDCFTHWCDRQPDQQSPEWFLEVCDPPHDIIYAQISGRRWWPAKLIWAGIDTCKIQYFCSNTFTRDIVALDEVRFEAIKPIDHNFDRKKFNDNWLRPFLSLVYQHLNSLIKSGFNPDNKFSKAMEIFAKYNIWENYVPNYKRKTSRRTVSQTIGTKQSKQTLKVTKIKDKNRQKAKNRKIKPKKDTYNQSNQLSPLIESEDISTTNVAIGLQKDGPKKKKRKLIESENQTQTTATPQELPTPEVIEIFDESDVDGWAEPVTKEETPSPDTPGFVGDVQTVNRRLASDEVSDEQKIEWCRSLFQSNARNTQFVY